MNDPMSGGARPGPVEARLAQTFAEELEAAHRDVAARPEIVTSRRGQRRAAPVVFAAAVMVLLVGLGVATVTGRPAPAGPSGSAAPTEPTDEHVEAARWVTGYLKYLYKLVLYPPDAAAPSPNFLFTNRGLAEALGQDDLLRRAVAREIFVGLDYDLRRVCVVKTASAGVEMDITLDLRNPVEVLDPSRSQLLDTLAPGPRHLRIVVVHDDATGHWVIDHWHGSPFEAAASAAPSATPASLGCS
jgi:hypothetical protein